MFKKEIQYDNLYSWCIENNRNDLIAEWNNEKNAKPMTDYSSSTSKKIWWRCSFGHEWETLLIHRKNGSRCPYCTNRKVLYGFNDFETWCFNNNRQDLLDEWDYNFNNKKPSDYVSGSQLKVKWICSKGHSYSMSTGQRTKNGNCPYCSSQLLLAGFNDLATKNPELAKEWNYEKNTPFTPSDFMAKSNRKVWWKCKEGHEWISAVSNRSEGNGCPYCSGKKALAGYNDLATVSPKLAAEWHPNKNGDLKPSDIRPHYGKKVWWRCERGHEWQATVDSRSSGRGCPFCNPQTSFAEQAILFYIKQAFSDAVSRDIHLGMELDIYIPSVFTAIEYDGQAWHNSKNKESIDIQKNNLCMEHNIKMIRIREPELSKLPDCINIIRTDKKSDKSLTKAITELLLIVGKTDIKVDINKDRNDILSGYITDQKMNSLEYKYPEIAKEWHPTKNGDLKPSDVPFGASYKAWWLCSKGHEWQVSVNGRTNRQNGCPICDNISRMTPVVSYERSLKKWCLDNHNERLINEYSKENKWSSDEIAPHSGYKVKWECSHGHKWEATVGSRVSGVNCPYCSGRKISKGENDLLTLRPDLAKEWDYDKNEKIKPDEVALHSNIKVWWRCSNGHEWKTAIANRAAGRGCPYCSNKKVLQGYNDLQTTNPQLAKEWHTIKNAPIKPSDVTIGSERKVWWQCENGHEWKAIISNRAKGVGCPYCCGRIPIVGISDLATTMPELAAEWHPTKNGDLLPKDVSAGAERKVWWICAEGHEWQAYVGNRTRGTGCPICYKRKRMVRNLTTGELFDNAVLAGKAYNVSASSIVYACKKHSQCKGCYWEQPYK